jgi:hypothetical protein
MSRVVNIYILTFIILLLTKLVTSCSSATPIPTATVLPSETQTPIPTSTLTPTISPTITSTNTPTTTPTSTGSPTPTPTLLGGYPGLFLASSVPKDMQIGINLYSADGLLLENIYNIPLNLTEIFDVHYPNQIASIKWSPTNELFAAQNCERRLIDGNRLTTQCDLYIFSYEPTEIITIIKNTWRGYDWSPDGQWIVYSGITESYGADLYLISSDGLISKQLIDSWFTEELSPIFSPDGNEILYWSSGAYLRIMNTDGSNIRNVWKAWDKEFNWSPDGTRIALSALFSYVSDIYLVNPDGTNRVRLTFDEKADDRNPIFSPDGKALLYYSRYGSDPSVYRIFVISMDDPRNPILVGKALWNEAHWTPDGSLIVFNGYPAEKDLGKWGDLLESPRYYAVRPDGSELTLLSEEAFGLISGSWIPNSIPVYKAGVPSFFITPSPTCTPPPTDAPIPPTVTAIGEG